MAAMGYAYNYCSEIDCWRQFLSGIGQGAASIGTGFGDLVGHAAARKGSGGDEGVLAAADAEARVIDAVKWIGANPGKAYAIATDVYRDAPDWAMENAKGRIIGRIAAAVAVGTYSAPVGVLVGLGAATGNALHVGSLATSDRADIVRAILVGNSQ